jgi:acyl carrier protein
VARQSDESDESAIRDWCVAYLAKSLDRSAGLINPDAKFARLGVASAASVFFLVDLEEWLDIELPAETLVEHPTINKLARHLATNGAADAVRAPQQS